MPRLEWEDRKFEQNKLNKPSEVNTPARVLVAGGYSQGVGGVEPFVGLVQLQRKPGQVDTTMIRCFEMVKGARILISSINFGPYDNGHIILGLSNGSILIMSSLDL